MIRTSCLLYIYGFGMDFDTVTECVGLVPTRTTRAGADQQRWGAPESGWVWEVTREGTEERPPGEGVDWEYPSVMEPLGQLLGGIATRIVDIREFCAIRGYEITIVIVVASSSEALPYFHITKNAIGLIAKLGADIDYDIYTNMGPLDTDAD